MDQLSKRSSSNSFLRWIGIGGSSLCLLHCIATPILVSIFSVSFTKIFHGLDLVFIGLAVVGVVFSSKKATKNWIQRGLWIALVIFGIGLFLERYYSRAHLVHIPSSIALIIFNIFNLRSSRCGCEHNNNVCAAETEAH